MTKDLSALPVGAPAPARPPLRLAHRGDHRRYPENTLAAFHAALALPGCDGLEFDVRGARDGAPIVLHDATLARVQRRPERAAELDAAELDALGVPTLAAVLAAVPPSAFLDIELKEDLAAPVVALLRAARGPALAHAALSSFDPAILAHVRTLAPGARCWLNAEDLDPAILAQAAALGCAAVAAEWHAIDRRSIARAHGLGLAVVAWTVRRRATFARLAGLGVAGVCVEGAALDG